MLESRERPQNGACAVSCTHVENGSVHVAVAGEIDMYTVAELERVLATSLAADTSTLAIDLAQCEFVDSTALGVLVELHRRLERASGRLELVAPSREVSRALELTGLDRLLAIREAGVDA